MIFFFLMEIEMINGMGGRLPAVAGMPANQAFLEFSAGQSDLPKKMHVPITKIG